MDIGVFGARGIPSTYSGYETFLTELLPELVRRGHRVTMYCRSASDGSGRTYRGVELVRLPSVETKRLSTLSHGVVAATVARFRRHDVLLVVNVANAPYCALLRLSSQRVVMNTDGQEWLRGKWGRSAKRYFRWCANVANLGSSALISDCRAMQQVYEREFGAPSSVIPYPAMPSSDLDPMNALNELGLEPERYVVVAARLNPVKIVDRIVEAFARTALDVPLVVLGAANYASEVVPRVEAFARRDDRIRFVGHVAERAAFGAILRHALAYVHGHSVGGINPSLVEAMSVGALVVALDTTFNSEALDGAGLLFCFEGHGLERTLEAVASLPDETARRLRASAVDRATTTYSLTAVADAYEDLLTRVTLLRSAWQRASIETAWENPAGPS
jgi:glycosyltransferase involved in cell wall biosynthesis